ncbi:amidase [candidate division KSB1 bacterium]|nr:amidase [candidate division KSB1 bacterium]
MIKEYTSPLLLFIVSLAISGCTVTSDDLKPETDFNVIETTISGIHAAFRSGELTSLQLVNIYLERIEVYDQKTHLNSILIINPNARRRAEELDKEFKDTGILLPLHGIPIIVKDNYDTFDLQTAAGSMAMKGSIPPDDAYQVRVLREAGAIVLAKSNMAEWAFSPYQTVSSIGGLTRNPYDLERVPAGSSGGTGASVSANFGVVGLGTDTGNSIRGPSSHASLVGIRSTIGATSRDGIVPLNLRNDIGGPMARTVEDAVRIFQVIVGYDPADPVTEASRGNIPDDYMQFLDENGLQGARIGVFRTLSNTETTDEQVAALFERAIEDMRGQGAVIVDPFVIPDWDDIRRNLWRSDFRRDVNHYFASLGPDSPVKTITEVYESGLYSPYIEGRLKARIATEIPPELADKFFETVDDDPRRSAFRDAILSAMDDQGVDVIIYPTWGNPPRLIGDLDSPHGDNSQQIPPHSGQPALTVPMGFTYGNLPAGLQIVGRLFGEPDIIKVAYAYEQLTKHRHPPEMFGAIK